jgi:hypothetical protein
MSTSNNKSTDEAEIRDLVESWGKGSPHQESRWNSGQPLPGDIDVRRPASRSIEGN